MRWNKSSLDRLATQTFQALQKQNLVTLNGTQDQIMTSISRALDKEIEKDKQLDRDARQMVEQLEQQGNEGFERHKMLQMIRKKLADERKIPSDKSVLFAKKIVDAPWGDELVDYADDDQALTIAKQVVRQFIQKEEVVDDAVRQKLQSLKRGVVEGSSEWDVLYRKYYDEELQKAPR